MKVNISIIVSGILLIILLSALLLLSLVLLYRFVGKIDKKVSLAL